MRQPETGVEAALTVQGLSKSYGSRVAVDGVSFEVTQAEAALDDFGTIADASRSAGRGILAAARAFTTSPQIGFPVLPVPILFDPGVNGAG
jgi:ABC-type phosphonate transport system ATPase subunit